MKLEPVRALSRLLVSGVRGNHREERWNIHRRPARSGAERSVTDSGREVFIRPGAYDLDLLETADAARSPWHHPAVFGG